MMMYSIRLTTVLALAVTAAPVIHAQAIRDRAGDLRLGSYITASQVQDIAGSAERQAEALAVADSLGLSRVFLEVYRSGNEVSVEDLTTVRDLFREHGVEAAGGIATTPGGDVGVPNEGPLTWFNWQNPKTQDDLEGIIRRTAPVFDTFIVDDFFCTGDVSEESEAAKGDRSWSDYRRELLSGLSQSIFVGPAKEVNPDITMIIKYPQWYDLFHQYGYDVANQWKPFDQVWVGTETRGARTQRFGFTQPYEGFVNYRWIGSVTGDKLKGAWFDHGDVAENDFVDQCYMSILAGAPELTFFEYGSLLKGHPDHAKVRAQFEQMADLAAYVKDHPAEGVAAYKPVNSDAWPDVYLFDFLGMLGVPLVPVSALTGDESAVVLGSQAAEDPNATVTLRQMMADGVTATVTPGFLHKKPEAALYAGVALPGAWQHAKADAVRDGSGDWHDLDPGLNVAGDLAMHHAAAVAEARVDGVAAPVLTVREHDEYGGVLQVLNTYTYTPQDFADVNEVLLSPKPQGLLEVPRDVANTIRRHVTGPAAYELDAPARVTLHKLGEASFVIQNFNENEVEVGLKTDDGGAMTDRFAGNVMNPDEDGWYRMTIPARGRVWIVRD